jgi:hypothetical protein
VRQLVTPLIPSSVVAVDFIHNGKMDLAVANTSSGNRAYLLPYVRSTLV